MKLGSFTSGWHYEAKKVQKSVMHLRSCCFAYLNVHFFAILVAVLTVTALLKIISPKIVVVSNWG